MDSGRPTVTAPGAGASVDRMSTGGGERDGSGADFTETRARAVLAASCAGAGLDTADARLLRLGSNAVYRLAAPPVIVRIARGRDSLPEMERAVRVARWPAEENFPATRLVGTVPQPAVVDGRIVTFWENAQDQQEYARLDEPAESLRPSISVNSASSDGSSMWSPSSLSAQ